MSQKKPPRPACGVEFPKDAKGERSTTEINKETFAVAIEAIDADLASKVRAEKKWRGRYSKYLLEQVEASLRSPQAALNVASAGLNYLHNTMEFVRDDKCTSFKEAMATITSGGFETGVVQGEAPTKAEAVIPYKGKMLRGDALKVQVDKWVRSGVIELSCGHAMTQVADRKDWLDLSGLTFVMLGASSAMGPFPMLMALGATVVAVDIDRPNIWKKLIGICKSSSGKLVFPLKKPQGQCANDDELAEAAGCNLLEQAPEIRNWLLTVEPKSNEFAVGVYAYLDGPLFMKISVAMDGIVDSLVAKRKASVAYLCTPTDAHVVPAAAMDAAGTNLRKAPMWQGVLAMFLKGPKAMKPNKRKPVMAENGEEFYVCDATVVDQGPNYILAKRLQHWRCLLTREAGCKASSNIAPSTATVSVVSNKMFALAYKGMHNFKPVEVFEQETSSAVMGLLLVNDLRNQNSVANPAVELGNPLALFADTSFHGGAWRCGYKFGNIGVGSVLSAIFTNYILAAFLVLYNVFQTLGWSLALFKIVEHATAASKSSSLWEVAGPTIGWFQWLAVAEICFALLGMVRSPVATTGMQVFSRLMLVECVRYSTVAQGNDNIFLWMMCIAWSVTEIVRYSFYALNLAGISLMPLTFLRYTLFLVLYPTGVAGEMGCLWKSIPDMVANKSAYESEMVKHMFQPVLRHSLGYPLVVVPVYVIGLYTLYSYMLVQRKKVLGGGRAKGGKMKKN
mmetsp:Transcript_149518/g.261260  ORF Transcript_149518/g.261260 Transcript_149518/m.261260 type:complete len:734 (-) Transcript_149518:109-2310(-)